MMVFFFSIGCRDRTWSFSGRNFHEPTKRLQCLLHWHQFDIWLSCGHCGTWVLWKVFPAAAFFLMSSQVHCNKHSAEMRNRHIFADVYSRGSIGVKCFLWLKSVWAYTFKRHYFMLHECIHLIVTAISTCKLSRITAVARNKLLK